MFPNYIIEFRIKYKFMKRLSKGELHQTNKINLKSTKNSSCATTTKGYPHRYPNIGDMQHAKRCKKILYFMYYSEGLIRESDMEIEALKSGYFHNCEYHTKKLYSLIYGCPITCLNINISCLVASSICWGLLSPVSAPKSIIFAANSLPVSFSIHLRTVELIPL